MNRQLHQACPFAEFLNDRNEVNRLIAFMEVLDGAKNDAIILTIEIIFPQDLTGLFNGLATDEHGPQHTLLGLHILRGNPVFHDLSLCFYDDLELSCHFRQEFSRSRIFTRALDGLRDFNLTAINAFHSRLGKKCICHILGSNGTEELTISPTLTAR